MAKPALTDQLELESGAGYSPCSAEYKALHDEWLALVGRGISALSPEEKGLYQSKARELEIMTNEGHLGPIVKY